LLKLHKCIILYVDYRYYGNHKNGLFLLSDTKSSLGTEGPIIIMKLGSGEMGGIYEKWYSGIEGICNR
jgi:hypothetical protein